MKILITGGTDFIDLAVIRRLTRNTADFVVNIDKLTDARNHGLLADITISVRYVFDQLDIGVHSRSSGDSLGISPTR